MNILGHEISFKITPKNIEASFMGKKVIKTERINNNDKAIIDKIINNFTDRSTKDISKWKTAELMAEHPEKPRRNFLQDLFKDLKKDGHFKSLVRLRKYTTLNSPFTIKDDDKKNKEANDFFNQAWFFKFLGVALDAIIEGHTLIEFKYFSDKEAFLLVVPRRNVVPEKHIIIPDLSKDNETIDFEDEYFKDWMLEIGERSDLGIMNDLIPYLIWKRNVAFSWIEFCEKFGQPMLSATTNNADPKHLDRLEELLDQLGEASTAVFPTGTTIDYKEANRTDAYQTYKEFIQYCKDEMSVAIVGGTMITGDGSSRSQSEVHERNLTDKIAIADKRSIMFLVNDCLIPLLIEQGYTFLNEKSKLSFDQSHGLNLKDYWIIVKGIMEEYEVPDDFLTKNFYVPITGKKKIPVANKNKSNITGFRTPNYNAFRCCPEEISPGITAQSFFDLDRELNTLHKGLISKIWNNKNTLAETAKITVTEAVKLTNGLFKGWGKRRTAAAWNEPDHLALHYMEFNLYEFAHTKTEARLAAINELLIDKEKLEIRSFEKFEKLALERVSTLNKAYLRTEHNLSISVGQGAAAYHRANAEKDTVTSLVIYQTVGDSKVRPDHKLLHGKIFNLSDPEAMRLWPPNAYNDRCEMLQYVGTSKPTVTKGKDAIKLLGDTFQESPFDVNHGNLKKVFTKKQFYTSDTSGLNDINKLEYKSYGLPKYASFKQTLNTLKRDSSITKNNANELFSAAPGTSDYMEYDDYLKRKLLISKKTFNTHTSGKYIKEAEGARHQLFPFVEETLKSPTEVWLQDYNKNRFNVRYIKVYKDIVLVVDCKITPEGLEIQTWYPLAKDEAELRIGLLIKGKDL
jgi:SPP1 gp7 family putative phage head morphogenesis protein